MKFTWTTTILTCVLLADVFKPLAVTSIVTSYEKLRQFMRTGDTPLLQAIQDAIDEKLAKIDKLTTAIQTLTTLLTKQSMTLSNDNRLTADHPNTFYLLIKNYVRTWHSSNTILTKEVLQSHNISLPTLDDFAAARLALIRLQYVYTLRARDMFEGNYLGYKGPALTKEDAVLLGCSAFARGYVAAGRDWLQLSASLLENVVWARLKQTQSSAEGEGTPIEVLLHDYFLLLPKLARAHLYLNETDRAWKLYDYCKESKLVDHEALTELRHDLHSEEFQNLQKRLTPFGRQLSQNARDLCSREKRQRIYELRPHHVCRYKSNPFLPYQRFEEEILSMAPYVSLFYNVVYDAEIEKLKELARDELGRGRISTKSGDSIISTWRTGDLSWLVDSRDPLVAQLSLRLRALTRLDLTIGPEQKLSGEPLQVVNYGLAGHYDLHLDTKPIMNVEKDDDIQKRLATVLLYLSDVEKGGATVFPAVGVSVTPVKGMALFWYNFPPTLTGLDWDTVHSGCPVLIGNKWIANKWIWTYGNTFRRPCGPSPESEQLDVEKIVSVDALKEIIE